MNSENPEPRTLREIEMLADGSLWIWDVASDRWPEANQLLDFYHGGEHLWEPGRAIGSGDEVKTKEWVEQRLHKMRHGQEQKVLKELAALKVPRGAQGEIVEKQQNYFAGQAGRMNYRQIADRSWPIGSGRSNRRAVKASADSKGPDSSGPKEDCVICPHWTTRDATSTGTIFGKAIDRWLCQDALGRNDFSNFFLADFCFERTTGLFFETTQSNVWEPGVNPGRLRHCNGYKFPRATAGPSTAGRREGGWKPKSGYRFGCARRGCCGGGL